MKATPSKREAAWNAGLSLLAGLGILISLLGIGIDALPGSYPGLSLPQLLLTVAGLTLALVAFALRSAAVRRRVLRNMRRHWAPGLLIAAITLIVLEFVLAVADIPTYFPPPIDDVPMPFYQPVPWWTCDEAGCHYVHEHIDAACESGQVFGRRCIVNQQGFHDSQDFVAGDDFDERMRILMLGDSFTFGQTADIGKSYVETIEANFPQSIVWNTAMRGTGTEQALASFQVYAPILQPQLAILGFFMNDFLDNMLPIDHWIVGIDWKNEAFRMRRYDLDWRSGAVTELDDEALYYRRHIHVDPPDSELERLIGRTRLGSLLPRFFEARMRQDEIRYRRTGPPFSQFVDITRRYLKALRAAAAAQDTALLVVLIPNREDVLAPTPRYQNALAIMEELGLPHLNPIHALDVELDYAPEPDTHWNTAGHQKVGKMLSDCLAVFQISGDLADCEQVKMP